MNLRHCNAFSLNFYDLPKKYPAGYFFQPMFFLLFFPILLQNISNCVVKKYQSYAALLNPVKIKYPPVAHRSNKFILFLIGLLIASTLININAFGPPTLSAYFFYTILGSLLAIIAGVGLIKNKQTIQLAHPLPILFFGLLAIYYFFNGWVNGNGGINLRHYIILADAVLLISFCALLSKGQINLLAISKIITIITIIESLICFLQQFGIILSLDALFKVTGSNENPNVTAMFLAMAVPAVLLVLFQGSKTYRFLAIASFTFCLLALGFLQCRTAFIGTAVCIILILNHQYQLLHKLQNKFSKPILIIIVATTLCLTAIAFTLLYHSKQASSDGRLFIWKISLQAIAQKPILGSGYGQFEHDYNLVQAKYFATGNATEQEIRNADYVHMSYNEFLENLFEGGIIGLVLFVGLLVALLFSLPAPLKCGSETPTAKNASPLVSGYSNGTPFRVGVHKSPFRAQGFFAYAGIITFTIMCFFNFTIQAIPVRCLLVFYMAVCCVEGSKQRYPIASSIPFLAISLFLFFKTIPQANAYHQCKKIVETSDNVSVEEAKDKFDVLEKDMNNSSYFWRSYGNILFKADNNDVSLQKLKNATALSSNPNIYLEMANCYIRMHKFREAITAITTAKNIQPHLFSPLYALMKVYGYAKDTTNTQRVAKEIIAMHPKIASEEVTYYKQQAKTVLSGK